MATSNSEYFGGGAWLGFGDYLRHKNRKMIDQLNSTCSKRTLIFENVVAHIDGETILPDIEIRRLIVENGGEYNHYDHRNTTHMIADTLAVGNRRWRSIQEGRRTKFHIVTSQWILDSIEKKQQCDPIKYRPGQILGASSITSHLNKPTKLPIDQNKSNDLRIIDARKPDFVQNFLKNSRLSLIGLARDRIMNEIGDRIQPLDPPVSLSKQMAASCLLFNVANPMTALFSANNIGNEHQELNQPQQAFSMEFLSFESANKRWIAHIDFDAFFVAVAIRNRPELKNHPVAVAHTSSSNNDFNSTSELSSINYPARAFGIKKGMFLTQARQLCPNLTVLPYDFEGIKKCSSQLYEIILLNMTLKIVPIGCDECFFQIDGTSAEVESKASVLRNIIFEETQCDCTIGIGPNFFLAKLATNHAKPQAIVSDNKDNTIVKKGIFVLKDPREILKPDAPLRLLHGIGRAIEKKLEAIDVRTIGGLRTCPISLLQKILGEQLGMVIWRYSLGVDSRTHQNLLHEEKSSLTVSVNYGIRLTYEFEVISLLRQFAEEGANRLYNSKSVASAVNMEVMKRRDDAPSETFKYMGHGIVDTLSASRYPLNTIKFLCNVPSDVNLEEGKASVLTSFTNLLHDALAIIWRNQLSSSCPVQDLRGVSISLTGLKKWPESSSKRRLESKEDTQGAKRQKLQSSSQEGSKHPVNWYQEGSERRKTDAVQTEWRRLDPSSVVEKILNVMPSPPPCGIQIANLSANTGFVHRHNENIQKSFPSFHHLSLSELIKTPPTVNQEIIDLANVFLDMLWKFSNPSITSQLTKHLQKEVTKYYQNEQETLLQPKEQRQVNYFVPENESKSKSSNTTDRLLESNNQEKNALFQNTDIIDLDEANIELQETCKLRHLSQNKLEVKATDLFDTFPVNLIALAGHLREKMSHEHAIYFSKTLHTNLLSKFELFDPAIHLLRPSSVCSSFNSSSSNNSSEIKRIATALTQREKEAYSTPKRQVKGIQSHLMSSKKKDKGVLSTELSQHCINLATQSANDKSSQSFLYGVMIREATPKAAVRYRVLKRNSQSLYSTEKKFKAPKNTLKLVNQQKEKAKLGTLQFSIVSSRWILHREVIAVPNGMSARSKGSLGVLMRQRLSRRGEILMQAEKQNRRRFTRRLVWAAFKAWRASDVEIRDDAQISHKLESKTCISVGVEGGQRGRELHDRLAILFDPQHPLHKHVPFQSSNNGDNNQENSATPMFCLECCPLICLCCTACAAFLLSSVFNGLREGENEVKRVFNIFWGIWKNWKVGKEVVVEVMNCIALQDDLGTLHALSTCSLD